VTGNRAAPLIDQCGAIGLISINVQALAHIHSEIKVRTFSLVLAVDAEQAINSSAYFEDRRV
jgi:hypothetical protein